MTKLVRDINFLRTSLTSSGEKKRGFFCFICYLLILEEYIERIENFIDMTKLIRSSLTSSDEKERGFPRFA